MNTMHNNEDEEEKNSYLLIILYIAKNLNDFDVFFYFSIYYRHHFVARNDFSYDFQFSTNHESTYVS